jgi:hypothetical protein
MARIGVFDIECHTFRFKADLGFMLCAGFKEFGKPGVEVLARDNIQRNPLNDKKLVKAIYDKLLTYDMVVTHNGRWFDIPWLNSRLLHWGLAPLPSIPHFDTCDAAYKRLRVGNSLKALGKFLGCKVHKTETDMNDWLLAGAGKKRALKTIVTHNIHDVRLTEEVYRRMRPLGFKHPNVALINEDGRQCPICGKKDTLQSRGWLPAKVNRAKRYQCTSCGAWSHARYEKVKGIEVRL